MRCWACLSTVVTLQTACLLSSELCFFGGLLLTKVHLSKKDSVMLGSTVEQPPAGTSGPSAPCHLVGAWQAARRERKAKIDQGRGSLWQSACFLVLVTMPSAEWRGDETARLNFDIQAHMPPPPPQQMVIWLLFFFSWSYSSESTSKPRSS